MFKFSLILTIILLLLPFLGESQNYAPKEHYLVDSLDLDQLSEDDKLLIESGLRKFHTAESDTGKIIALNAICEGMYHDDWHKYQFYQYHLIKNALKKDNSKQTTAVLTNALSGALNNLGIIYEIKGDIKKAIGAYKESIELDLKRNEKRGIAATLNNLGFVYDKQGNIPKALEIYHQSLKILEEFKDVKSMAVTLNNIGLIYKYQNDSANALKYLQKSYDYREKVGDKNGMANSLNNIGLVYGVDEQALATHLKSLEIRTEIGDKYGAAFSYINIGAIHLENGKTNDALACFQKSLDLREEIGDKNGVSISLIHLGKTHLKLGNLLQAKNNFETGMAIAQEIGYPTEVQVASEYLSTIYEKELNYKKSLDMYKLTIQMRDSLNNEKNQRAVIQQQAKYEYEKQKTIDDSEHEKQIALEQEQTEKQQIITYATGLGLGLVGIFLLVVVNRLKVTRKQKAIIESQKELVEKQKEEVVHAHHELEEKNKEITDSIQYAKRIQNAILPPAKVVKEYLQNSFILYKPKDIVAGDFYWLEQKDGKTLFAAADCTGHGVPGAMVSVVCNNGLNRSVREYGLTDPGEILSKTRETVIAEFEKSEEEVKDGMDIALCSLEGNILKYAGANNPLWIIRNGAHEIEEIKADKQPIGKYAENIPFTTHTIELQKGDSIYIFSDGYADQFGGEKGKKFKAANFKTLLLSIQHETIEKQKQLISETFETWKGNLEQLDDVCVIGIRI